MSSPVLVGKIPVVATIHDARDLARPDFFIGMSRLKRWYMYWFIRRCLRGRATVITVSHAMAEDLSRVFSVPKERIVVTHEAADTQFQPATSEAVTAFRERYGLSRPFLLSSPTDWAAAKSVRSRSRIDATVARLNGSPMV